MLQQIADEPGRSSVGNVEKHSFCRKILVWLCKAVPHPRRVATRGQNDHQNQITEIFQSCLAFTFPIRIAMPIPPVALGARDIPSGSRPRLRHPRWLSSAAFSASCWRPFGSHEETFPAFLRANVPPPNSSIVHQPFPPAPLAACEHAAQNVRLLPPFRRASRPG